MHEGRREVRKDGDINGAGPHVKGNLNDKKKKNTINTENSQSGFFTLLSFKNILFFILLLSVFHRR